MNDQQKKVASAYAEAAKRLRHKHIDEFHDLLGQVYEERGITVIRRLRGSRKALVDLQKAQAAVSVEV